MEARNVPHAELLRRQWHREHPEQAPAQASEDEDTPPSEPRSGDCDARRNAECGQEIRLPPAPPPPSAKAARVEVGVSHYHDARGPDDALARRQTATERATNAHADSLDDLSARLCRFERREAKRSAEYRARRAAASTNNQPKETE